MCAKFCHKGHQIEVASEDLWINESCSCGSGAFDNCPSINSKNPVGKLQGHKKCSVMHKIYNAIQKQNQTTQKETKVLPES